MRGRFRLGATVWRAGEHLERAVLLGAAAALSWVSPPLHAGQAYARWLLLPARTRVGADDPAVRAYHPRPERRHRQVIGPRSADMIARWWQFQRHTSSDRTPLARMLPRVMGSIGSFMRPAAIRRL